MYFAGVKPYQRHLTHICDHRNIEYYPESIPSSPTFGNKSNSSITSSSPNLKTSNARPSESLSPTIPTFVPRQRLLLVYAEDKKVTVYLYNWSQDLTQNIMESITRLNKWHHYRNSLLNNLLFQKIGIFHGLEVIQSFDVEKNTKDSKSSVAKAEVDTSPHSTLIFIEQLIKHHSFPSKENQNTSTSASTKSSLINYKPSHKLKTLKNIRPPVPFQLSHYVNYKDEVMAHGLQFLNAIVPQRKDMQALYNMWQTRGSNVTHPFDRVFQDLKRQARLSHYCLTPLLFSPSWRYKVAPIRDHALEPFDQLLTSMEKVPEITTSNRSRHSSGSSLKTSEFSSSGGSTSTRMRRMSGAAGYPGSNQGSPKLRTKTPSEETWHSTVCHHYLQEYVQYLHTVGFVALQSSETAEKVGIDCKEILHLKFCSFSVGSDDDRLSRSDSFSRRRGSPNYLIKCMLGGLLVFELGLSDPYAFGHLYSLECSRFAACNPRTLSSAHLPTRLSSDKFLDDFIKYYQKVPTGARNSVFSGTLLIPDVNMSGDQLYNYIISHNKLYGMSVLRMIPIILLDNNSNIDTEYALVELSAQKASYKDVNDVCQMGSFDVGILINQNTTDPALEPNSLILNFYIILTSQRDLYPKLSNFGATLGSFQTVRLGSSLSSSAFSSRKTSTVSLVTERLESSGEESVHSTDSGGRSKRASVVRRRMCDEDVMYLGYYSSQETMMQQVLHQQAEAARLHLKQVVQQASVHCRRDFLWSSLLPRSLREDNSSKDHSLSSYGEFAELLELVSIVPLNGVDSKLTPFMVMHLSWYTTLAPVLKTKYADSHREFVSPDNNSLYVVVSNTSCPDSFMLLTVDTKVNRAELCLVFREQPTDLESSQEKPSQRILALQNLVEEFVNACCFHLWTCILPL
ncbi:KICSTOR complex protein SZT2 [Caerostris extrusa]|uniref:KICSTOR complex protein SZT2 n=1 Tax=Caerostris extrusa TaxID=172846 RepID=A0AAV4XPQ6_CAEEX|nr:KICSTOR complex protein SZT2 [Caerostris extrusa]